MLIGIGHVARVGKSVAASALVRDLGFKEVSFAGPLKDLAFKINPVVVSANALTNVQTGSNRYQAIVSRYGLDDAKVQFPEVRRFLQDLGGAVRDMFGEDFWSDRAFGEAKKWPDVVISDVRYPNEAEQVKALGGKLVRIDRPGREALGHVSETALLAFKDWDEVLVNDGDVPALEAKIVKLATSWRALANKKTPAAVAS